MNYLYCNLYIQSDLLLDDLAKLISSKIFNDSSFSGKNDYIRDEVPAIYIDCIMGLRVVLHGYGSNDGYILEMSTKDFPWENYPNKGRAELGVNINDNIIWLLRETANIQDIQSTI